MGYPRNTIVQVKGENKMKSIGPAILLLFVVTLLMVAGCSSLSNINSYDQSGPVIPGPGDTS